MVATKHMSAKELESLGEDSRMELIDGEPFEMSPTGQHHTVVSARISRQLTRYSLDRPEYHVWGNEGGYLLKSNPDTVLAPDIAVLTEEQVNKLPHQSNAFIPLAPALVAEVKSHSDRESVIARKLSIYLEAGVQEVWWVRPQEGQMSVHRPDRAHEIVATDQTFTGSDVLPGFSLSMPDLLNSLPASH